MVKMKEVIGMVKELNGKVCHHCEADMLLDVLCDLEPSSTGWKRVWFLGYFCGCISPGSTYRKTGYYATAEEADEALQAWLLDCIVPKELDEST